MERRKDHAPPANWQDFEDLCLKLWRPRLIDAKKHGRSGQPQAGVDIFGRDPKTEAWVGIQCKQKGQWPPKGLTIRQIEDEIQQAENFEPPLSHFIVVTTARRDVDTQQHIRKLSEQRRDDRQFTVDLFAWDDILDLLEEEQPKANIRDDQIAERYTEAIAQLEDKSLIIRIGGIHELEQIAQAAPNRYHWSTMETLCSYVQIETAYIPGEATKHQTREAVGKDIQAILDVLARRDHEKDKGRIKIKQASLVSANLNHAMLDGSILDYTDFSRGKLFGAQLNQSLLNGSLFRGAVLEEASLQGASLYNSDLSLAILRRANLCGAYLTGANLSHSLLHGSDLGTANNLTQAQVNSAYGDRFTKLPDGLERPKSWSESRSENEIPPGYILNFMRRR